MEVPLLLFYVWLSQLTPILEPPFATECTYQPSQFIDSQASLSVCLVQLLPRTTPFLVMHKTSPVRSWWSVKIPWVMRLAKRTDTVLSNFTTPNFLSKLRHWLSPSSTSSPHFTRLSTFCQFSSCSWPALQKRGSQLSNGTVLCDTHTCVLSSGNSESSTLSFHFSHSHFHTTVGHVITLRWSLRNHFHSYTCVNHRILECFRARLIIAFRDDSAKTKIIDETNKKWNGVCCRTFPFTTCRSRWPYLLSSANQNWKRVCVFLCQKTVIESYDRSCPFSFLFINSTACPESSCSCIHLIVWFFDSFWLWEFLLLRVLHLLRFPFRHLHEIPQLVRCHHQLVLHLDPEFSLDLRAHCSAIPSSLAFSQRLCPCIFSPWLLPPR